MFRRFLESIIPMPEEEEEIEHDYIEGPRTMPSAASANRNRKNFDDDLRGKEALKLAAKNRSSNSPTLYTSDWVNLESEQTKESKRGTRKMSKAQNKQATQPKR